LILSFAFNVNFRRYLKVTLNSRKQLIRDTVRDALSRRRSGDEA
jgi:hypothetical protein